MVYLVRKLYEVEWASNGTEVTSFASGNVDFNDSFEFCHIEFFWRLMVKHFLVLKG